MDTKIYERYAILAVKKQHHKENIDMLNNELAELEKILIEQSLEEGIGKITVTVGKTEDGLPVLRTVHRTRAIRAAPHKDKAEELHQGLKDAGLHEYVQETVNRNSLAAYVRCFDEDGRSTPDEIRSRLPEQLKDVINITEDIKMVVRKR